MMTAIPLWLLATMLFGLARAGRRHSDWLIPGGADTERVERARRRVRRGAVAGDVVGLLFTVAGLVALLP